MMSELTSQYRSVNLQNWQHGKQINQTGTLSHGISGFADSAKLEIQQNWNSPHGKSGVAVLVDQHIDKTA